MGSEMHHSLAVGVDIGSMTAKSVVVDLHSHIVSSVSEDDR